MNIIHNPYLAVNESAGLNHEAPRTRIPFRSAMACGLVALIYGAASAQAQVQQLAPVDLGWAGSFAILSKSGITNVPTSAITGNIGTSPITGAAITGLSQVEVTGTIYTVNAAGPAGRVVHPSFLTLAVGDMEAAYTDAAGRNFPDVIELGGGKIDGMRLAPGLYKWGTPVVFPTGITLDARGDANAIWIMQIAQGLTVGNGAIVTLTGGAQAKNIFWQVGGAVTLGTTAQFKGIILCATGIAMKTGATLDGRALAQTAVTLQMNAVTEPK